MHASKIGNLRLIKLLLSKKANIDAKNVKNIQAYGENAFIFACKFNKFNIASYLIQCGANLNSRNNKGAKAIHYAVKQRNPDAICRLIEMGIKVNSADYHKKTLLHYAAKIGDNDIGILLVELGANMNAIDYKGRTPAGLAEDYEHFHFADALEKLGGKKINN